MKTVFKPIGVVRSPFKRAEDIALERNADPCGFDDVRGKIEVYEEYDAGLKDITGFSHLIVIFAFHESREAKLLVRPPLESRVRGVFATRSPHRPNSIGMTVVELVRRKGRTLYIRSFDMTEGTPVLDIKPYTDRDRKKNIRLGWLERNQKRAKCGKM